MVLNFILRAFKTNLKRDVQHYCEMILSIDERWTPAQSNRQSGLDENTLIFFTSDGGHLWASTDLSITMCI